MNIAENLFASFLNQGFMDFCTVSCDDISLCPHPINDTPWIQVI